MSNKEKVVVANSKVKFVEAKKGLNWGQGESQGAQWGVEGWENTHCTEGRWDLSCFSKDRWGAWKIDYLVFEVQALFRPSIYPVLQRFWASSQMEDEAS